MAANTKHFTFRVPVSVAERLEKMAETEELGTAQFLRKEVESLVNGGAETNRLAAMESRITGRIDMLINLLKEG